MTNLQKVPKFRGLIDKNRGWNWKFNGQLGVQLNKSETKDHITKGV